MCCPGERPFSHAFLRGFSGPKAVPRLPSPPVASSDARQGRWVGEAARGAQPFLRGRMRRTRSRTEEERGEEGREWMCEQQREREWAQKEVVSQQITWTVVAIYYLCLSLAAPSVYMAQTVHMCQYSLVKTTDLQEKGEDEWVALTLWFGFFSTTSLCCWIYKAKRTTKKNRSDIYLCFSNRLLFCPRLLRHIVKQDQRERQMWRKWKEEEKEEEVDERLFSLSSFFPYAHFALWRKSTRPNWQRYSPCKRTLRRRSTRGTSERFLDTRAACSSRWVRKRVVDSRYVRNTS